MMLLADRALKDADGVQISAGLTVEVYATLKKGLTVEDGAATFKKGLTVEDGAATFKKGLTVAGPANLGGDLKLGGFSEAETDEMEKMIWLRKVDFTDPMNQWDEKLIKHKSDKGHFKRAGFGIHMHSIREFGIWSSGPISRDLPESLFSVEGHTGNAFFKGNLTVAGTATTLRQENWYDVNSFFTGWKSFGGSHPAAGYFKDSFGVVHLRGLVVAAAGATKQIFILPLDYRPGFRPVHMVLFENTQFARIDVTTEGIVECEPLKLGWYSLDGITFRAGP
jgi:hypothetical protein